MSRYNFNTNIHCTFSQGFFLETFLTLPNKTDVTISKKVPVINKHLNFPLFKLHIIKKLSLYIIHVLRKNSN